jgi:signal transduction histidine kinase
MKAFDQVFKSLLLLILQIFLLNNLSLSAQNSNSPKTLKVGVYQNSPKIFIDSKGQAQGIFVDVIESTARKEAFQVEYITGSWHELFSKLKRGEIDILPDMAYSDKRDSLFLLNALPVLNSWLEIYSRKGVSVHCVKDLSRKTIGVLRASIQEKYLETQFPKDFNIPFKTAVFNSYPESTEALKRNETDVILVDRFFYYSKHIDESILPTGLIFRPTGLYLAFRKDIPPEIISMFDKHISELKNNAKSDYYQSLQIHLDKSPAPIVPAYIRRLITWLAIASVVLIVFVVLLRKQVKAKTKELRIKNHRLKYAMNKAEESEQLKSVFLQNIWHEIRTPMNGIIGFLNLLKRPDLGQEKKKDYIETVNRSAKRLLSTINDIVEISKIEAGQIELQYSDVKLQEIKDFIKNVFENQAEKKALKMYFETETVSEETLIRTDKYMLEIILSNLMNNAIKFTEKGSVSYGVKTKEDAIIFYVKDSGSGIPNNRLNEVFMRFVHSDLELTRSQQGSGLGLSIAKAYTEILNGKIWAESEIGKGSTFYVSIPLQNNL